DIGHYIALKELAAKLDEKYQAEGNRIFYMAMAPRFFGTIATHINDQKLLGSGFNRLVIEKPFGHALASAEKLNREIGESFDEESVRSEEHTSELQSRFDLVCRLLLEKKTEDE